jgi:hypothetical protein
MDRIHKIILSSQMDGPDHKKMVLNMDDVTICTYHTNAKYMTLHVTQNHWTIFNFQENTYAEHVKLCAQL